MDSLEPDCTTSDVRLLRLPDVLRRVGLSRSTVYQLAASGRFPAPVRLSPRTSAWRSDDVQAWIDNLQRARPAHKTQPAAKPSEVRR